MAWTRSNISVSNCDFTFATGKNLDVDLTNDATGVDVNNGLVQATGTGLVTTGAVIRELLWHRRELGSAGSPLCAGYPGRWCSYERPKNNFRESIGDGIDGLIPVG